MLYSSLTHPVPKPASHYKLIATALRKAGVNIANDDYDAIDNLLQKMRTRAPKSPRRS
jgi:hypothetical protein